MLLASGGSPAIFGIYWLVDKSHHPTEYSLLFKYPLFIRTAIILDWGPALLQYDLILIASAMTLLSQRIQYEVLGIRTST